MKKRIASLLMAIVMLASLGVGSLAATTEKTLVQGNNTGLSAANFKDLADATKPDGRHWAWDAIDHVVKFGLFNGTSATTFAPQNGMTRAQFVVVITRLENTSRAANNKLNVERVPTKTRFTDVPEDMWCAGAVAWAEANGIVEGYSDNTFKPNQVISRAQIAAFVYRYVNNYKKYNLKLVTPTPQQFTDFADAHQVFQSAIDYCRTHGLIQGYGDHSLRPNIAVTRAQVAAILSRIIIVLTTSSGRGGGGSSGGPGGGGAGASSFDSSRFNAANWADLNNYPLGVKYVAVDESGTVNTALDDCTADLNDGNNNTQNVNLKSGEGALVPKDKTTNGFKLTPKPSTGYAVTHVYVYDTVPPTDVVDRANAPVTKLLVEGTDYTLTNGVVIMAADRFTELQRVTVVAEFGVPKTAQTTFRFIAVNSWDATTTNSYATADFTVTQTENLTSGSTASQKSVMEDVTMAFNVQSGYEIPKPSDDIRVYNTSSISGQPYSPAAYTQNLRMNGIYALTTENNLNTIKIKGTDLKLSGDPNGLTEVTVVVRAAQSVYGYSITFNTSAMGETVDLDTLNSFSDKPHWLNGGDALKDALRLLFNDGTGVLGSNRNLNTGKINTAISAMLYKATDKLNNPGVPLDLKTSVSPAMLEGMIAETVAGEINKNVKTYAQNAAATAMAAEVQTQYNTLFNTVASQLQAQGLTVAAGTQFVDANGNAITANDWVNSAVSGMTVNANQVTSEDIVIGNISAITADMMLTQSGTNPDEIAVTPTFGNLGALTVTLKALTGTYTLNALNTGALYVMVNNPLTGVVAPQAVPVTGSYTGSSIILSKTGDINISNYAVPSSVMNSVSSAGFKFDQEQMQGILDQVVGGKLDQMKQDLTDAVAAAAGTGKETTKVNESLNNNLIALLKLEKYVKASKDGNILVVPGLQDTDAGKKNYRDIMAEYYDGFWNFHADLFQAYPDNAAKREAVLQAVLDWFRGVLGTSGGASKSETAATLLAKDRQPTVAQMFNALYDGTSTATVSSKTVDQAKAERTVSNIKATGKLTLVQNILGIDLSKQSIPVSLKVNRFNKTSG